MSVFTELTFDSQASASQRAESDFDVGIQSISGKSAYGVGAGTSRFPLSSGGAAGQGNSGSGAAIPSTAKAAAGLDGVLWDSAERDLLDTLYLTDPLGGLIEGEAALGRAAAEPAGHLSSPEPPLGGSGDAAPSDHTEGSEKSPGEVEGEGLWSGDEGETLAEEADLDGLDQIGDEHFNLLYDPNSAATGAVEFLDDSGKVTRTYPLAQLKNKRAPCFTSGTWITTDRGELLVEDLQAGDRLLTRDNGYQELLWVGRRVLSAEELAAAPELKPVRISSGALGSSLPYQDLVVSPQHRMLLSRARAEFLFGEQEVLVASAHLVGQPDITRDHPKDGVTYIHLMLDQHEIVRANGAWSESYQPGALNIAGLDEGPRQELLTLFPELAKSAHFSAARISLRKHEARLLLAE